MPSYDTEVLADTPQIYWKLQDTSGTSAVDSSGNTRPGTYNGTAGTNYALAQSVPLLASEPTLKSVKMMRDSAVEGGHPTTKANLSDATTTNGKASISRAYEAWMNVAGVPFSVESWVRVPATLNRYAGALAMQVASRRLSAPLQWQIILAGFNAGPTFARWEVALSAAAGQPSYPSSSFSLAESSTEAALAAPSTAFEQAIEDVPQYVRYGDLFDGLPHHLLAAAGASSARIYVDGLLGVSYYASNVPAIPANTVDPLIFGGYNTTGNMSGFMGWMSHCAHYPTELSAARAAAHFTAGGAKVTFLNQQWALLAASEMSLTESAIFAESIAYLQHTLINLTEAATFTVDLVAIGRQVVQLAEAATVTPAVSVQQRLSVVFMDAVSLSQQISESRFAQMLLSGVMAVNDVLAPTSRGTLNLFDMITAAIAIKAGDQELIGWVINPNLQASTMLDNYGFTGLGEHKGRYYGLKPDGLYVLEGSSDAGSPIESFISLGNRNLGTSIKKRVPYAYIGAASTGAMVLKVIADGQTFLYQVRNPTTDMAEQRVDIGRGLRANYWNFELMNQNGEDFDIDTIKFLPIVLERRI